MRHWTATARPGHDWPACGKGEDAAVTEDRAPIKSEVVEGIALVTFNAPTQNIATTETWAALAAALGTHAADEAVRVLVLTGAGHHVFVGDPVAAEADTQAAYDAAAADALAELAGFAKPVIARVRGDCIGTGLLVALHADLVVAAEDSSFALPRARWGAAYRPETVAALVRQVGPQNAKRLLFLGERMEAREARRIGLVALLVDDADLSDVVVDLARGIADNGPLAVAAAKRMVGAPDDPAAGDLVDQCLGSQDYAGGIAALRSGKRPVFQGR